MTNVCGLLKRLEDGLDFFFFVASFTGGCELPDEDAGNSNRVFWKKNTRLS